jgi:PEGA domain
MSTITAKDGTTIYFKDWGTGPIITFSHGWPLQADTEKGQAVVHRFEHVYGTLIVESDRPDAALRIDGDDYGNVPRLLLLSPGRHKLFLQAANAPDKTREVEIKVGYRTSVRINFQGGSPETKVEPETAPRRLSVPTPSPTPACGRSLFAVK